MSPCKNRSVRVAIKKKYSHLDTNSKISALQTHLSTYKGHSNSNEIES